MRLDLDVIENWVKPNTRVLDLGCGDGTLLLNLKNRKAITGVGIEINPRKFNLCIEKGLSVIEQDLDKGLDNFADGSFDVVVMSQTLQAMDRPDFVLKETLRIGKESIVAFPNFGHWYCRAHLSIKGRMPVSRFMPYSWYDTPNIHFCTIKDFEQLCKDLNIKILDRALTTASNQLNGAAKLWPNMLATTAIYHLSK